MKKKTDEKVKELNSLRENDEDEKTEMNIANNVKEAIGQINHYEEIKRTQHKRVI